GRQVAIAAVGVPVDDLVGGRQGGAGDRGDRTPVGARPAGQQVAEVEQWVADRRQLPVDDGGHARFGRVDQHVGEVEVAVDDAGPQVGRAVGLQPRRHLVDAGDVGAGG